MVTTECRGKVEDTRTPELPTRRCEPRSAHTVHARRSKRLRASLRFPVRIHLSLSSRWLIRKAIKCFDSRKTHDHDLDGTLGSPRADANSGQPTPDTKLATDLLSPPQSSCNSTCIHPVSPSVRPHFILSFAVVPARRNAKKKKKSSALTKTHNRSRAPRCPISQQQVPPGRRHCY